MAENKFMGTFDNETEVLRKIEEMKAQGAKEDDMYVMSRDKDQISMVRGRTDVDYKSSEGNWMDKFMGFLSGEEPTREAFSGMGVDNEEADRYYQEVQNGKILLFVDREFGASYEGKAPNDNTAYGEPTDDTTRSAGAVGMAGIADNSGTADNTRRSDVTDSTKPGYVDTGVVARDGMTVDTNEENDVYYNREDDALSEGKSTDQDIGGDETAGVGRDTGTGFGLGSDKTVDDAPSMNRNTEGFSDDTSAFGNDATEEEKLRLHEERLNVDKERVQTGEVNVGKHVVEEEQSVDVPVEREEAYVERRPVNEGDTLGSDSNLTGDSFQENENIHVPLSEERVNVSKDDVVNEEIVVGKRKVQDTETVNETVRREEADIDEDTNLTDDELDRNKGDRF